MQRNLRMRGAALALMLVPAVAFAQKPPQHQEPVAPKAERLDRNCAPADTRSTTGESPRDEKSSDSLSDRLAQSGGVICPPEHADPEINAPTPPGTGRMPVIPPPGGPGGRPDVQPK